MSNPKPFLKSLLSAAAGALVLAGAAMAQTTPARIGYRPPARIAYGQPAPIVRSAVPGLPPVVLNHAQFALSSALRRHGMSLPGQTRGFGSAPHVRAIVTGVTRKGQIVTASVVVQTYDLRARRWVSKRGSGGARLKRVATRGFDAGLLSQLEIIVDAAISNAIEAAMKGGAGAPNSAGTDQPGLTPAATGSSVDQTASSDAITSTDPNAGALNQPVASESGAPLYASPEGSTPSYTGPDGSTPSAAQPESVPVYSDPGASNPSSPLSNSGTVSSGPVSSGDKRLTMLLLKVLALSLLNQKTK